MGRFLRLRFLSDGPQHGRGRLVWGLGLCLGLATTYPAFAQRDEAPRESRGEGRFGEGRGGPGGGRFGGPGGMRGFGGEPSFSREMRRESFAEKINLTEEQKQLLNDIDMQRGEFFRSLPRNGGGGPGTEDFEKRMQEMQAKMKEFEQKAIDVLTPAQKAVWEERKAEVKAEWAAAEGNRGETRQRSDEGGAAATTTPAAPPRRTTFANEQAPDGTAPTASFASRGATAAAPGAVGGGTSGTRGTAETADPGDNGATATPETRLGTDLKAGSTLMSFNFRYAPWADVLKLFAEAANLTLDLNDVPPGTFNYYDEKSYTVTEALDVLNGYLLPKGYVLIKRDQFLVSLNIDNGIPPSLLPTITVEDLPSHGMNELVIVDVPLEGFEADKIVGEVKELTGPWGKVAAMKNTNSLNIMDTVSNITRIVRLLKLGTPPSGETVFRAIAMKHISAAEAERTVRRLFGLNPPVATSLGQTGGFSGFGGGFSPFGGFGGFRGGDSFRGGDDRSRGDGQNRDPRAMTAAPTSSSAPSPYLGKIQVTADTRTNHLLVTASASLVKVVEDLVKSIDVDTGVKTEDAGPAYLKAYVVAGGDAAQVAQTMNSIMPGIVVGYDAKSGKIHVQATADEHLQVDKLIQTLAGEASGSVAVINLQRLDPIQATNTLRNLFTNDARAPMIEADALGRRLLIRGSADQLAQVKLILQQLGEAGPGQDDSKVDRGPVRTLPLQGRNPEDVLPLMQKMWNAGERNPIRVVVPSQPNPIRDRRVPAGRSLDAESSDQSWQDDTPPATPSTTRPAGRPAIPAAPLGPATELPRRNSILQVSQSGEGRDNGARSLQVTGGQEDAAEELPIASPRSQAQPAETSATPSADAKQPGEAKPPGEAKQSAATGQSPIRLSIVGDDVIIVSEDQAALDQFEDMFNSLASALPTRTRWTVFYLRSADATETAQMLERLFPQSSVTSSTASSSGLFGSLTSGLSTVGRGMMNSTGLNQTLGGANDLRIITDTRANALFVTGPQDQIAEVEAMLELLDSSELPESLRNRVPRTIPVEYAEVDEVADIVQSVFKDYLNPEGQQGQGGNGQRFNPLAMLMGGGGGGDRKDPGVQLTVGVDRRTSHLIVACNDNLFRQIEGLVTSIDERARDARQTVQIIQLQTADPTLVSSTLTSLIPKVTISASRNSRRPQPGEAQQPQAPQAGAPGADPARDAELMRRMEQRRSGGTTGRTFGSGGGGGRTFGGGRTGGSTGGRGGSQGFGGGGSRGRGDR